MKMLEGVAYDHSDPEHVREVWTRHPVHPSTYWLVDDARATLAIPQYTRDWGPLMEIVSHLRDADRWHHVEALLPRGLAGASRVDVCRALLREANPRIPPDEDVHRALEAISRSLDLDPCLAPGQVAMKVGEFAEECTRRRVTIQELRRASDGVLGVPFTRDVQCLVDRAVEHLDKGDLASARESLRAAVGVVSSYGVALGAVIGRSA